ncbi:MAG: DUF4364 family protein [Eubacteriales bacterium]|nr:DUF4364 family protein [Clostridia bacterium]MDY2844685.1 DUF4364 family protein [Eubacteriales bacterium]
MPETFHSPQQVKVFILYLLEKVGYPLDYNDLATIIIRDGYVDYFDFVTYFHELLEDGHIKKISVPCDGAKDKPSEQKDENGVTGPDNSSDNDAQTKDLYEVSETGRMIAKGLADDLLIAAVREKSYISAMRHLSLEKRGAVVDHRIEMVGDGTYIFHCSIKDCDGMAFDLALRADSYLQVSRMRMNFEDKPDVVYRGIIALVTGNVNYLFEK